MHIADLTSCPHTGSLLHYLALAQTLEQASARARLCSKEWSTYSRSGTIWCTSNRMEEVGALWDMATQCTHVLVCQCYLTNHPCHLLSPWDPLLLLTCPRQSLSQFRMLQKTNTSHPLRSSKDQGHELAWLIQLQHHTCKACPTSLIQLDLTKSVPFSLFHLLFHQHNPPPSHPWQPLQYCEPTYSLVLVLCPPIHSAQAQLVAALMALRISSCSRVPAA
jgi:hypothetical protein